MSDRVHREADANERPNSRGSVDLRQPSYYVLDTPQPNKIRKRDENDNVDRYRRTRKPESQKSQNSLQGCLKTPAKKPRSCDAVSSNARRVTSLPRTPACNFLCEAPNSRNSSGQTTPRNRSGDSSPEREIQPARARTRHRRASPDQVIYEEPGEFVVWDASKMSSVVCPKSDPEYRCIGICSSTKQRGALHRSNSLPSELDEDFVPTPNKKYSSALPDQNSMIFKMESLCSEGGDVLEFSPLPLSPSQVSPSTSVASTTYSMKISLVTQQLQEIQQAQNDVLSHLTNEISKVTQENERLMNELEQQRSRNAELTKLDRKTKEELEKYKQIFKTQGVHSTKSSEDPSDLERSSNHSQRKQRRVHNRSDKHRHSEETTEPEKKQEPTGSGEPSGTPSCEKVDEKADKDNQGKITSTGDVSLPDDKGISEETPPIEILNTVSENESLEAESINLKKKLDDPPVKPVDIKRHSRSASRHHHHHHHHMSRSRSSRRSPSPSKSKSPGSARMITSRDRDQKHIRYIERSRSRQFANDSVSQTGCHKIFPCCWSRPRKKARSCGHFKSLDSLYSKSSKY